MVEELRVRLFGRLPAGVEGTEGLQGHLVHVAVHDLHIALEHGFQELVVGHVASREPAFYHVAEHDGDFLVGQLQRISPDSRLRVEMPSFHPQVAAGQEQAPDGVPVPVELVEDNFFIDFSSQRPTVQQIFHGHLDIRPALADQVADQAVGAGVGPVGLVELFFQKTGDRPGIVDVPLAAESEAVIPCFDLRFFSRHAERFQSVEHFFFCKAELSVVCF